MTAPAPTAAAPVLPAELPEYLSWLTEHVQGLLRQSAFVRVDPARAAPRGSTRAWGLPDLPADAPWAQFEPREKHPNNLPWSWGGSPYDGESFALQLDLQEIPQEARKPGWPVHGVVWVFIDLSHDWSASVRFDPRPRADIPWQPRLDAGTPSAAIWTLWPSLPDGTPKTMPDIWDTWRDVGGGLVGEYADWVQEKVNGRAPSDFQVGGWVWPIQGDFDERNPDFVCALTHQSFGDSGCVYLHYSAERGFYARVETH